MSKEHPDSLRQPFLAGIQGMSEAEKAFQAVYQAWLSWRSKAAKNRASFRATFPSLAPDFAIVQAALGIS